MNTFRNPIGKCGFFYTPESVEALQDYITRYTGSERVIAATIMGMTMNLCSAHIDGAIKEQQAEADAEYEADAQAYLKDLRGE